METKNATKTKKTTAKKTTVSDEDIRRKAEEIFNERMARGESGDHLSDWVKAEKELKKSR
jgi:uncharacterized membrane protein